MADKKSLLTAIGLSAPECDIYLALLGRGVSGISKISRETGVNRPAIYKTLPLLIRRGLVSEVVKKKQKLYVAEHPERLRRAVEEIHRQFGQALPEFIADYERVDRRPIVRFLTGKQGISFVFEDLVRTLKRGDTFYRYSAPKDLGRAEKYLPIDYRTLRDEKKLERLVITGPTIAAKKRQRLERSIKVLQKIEGSSFDLTQVIYGTKVALINYQSESVVLIEDPAIAEFQRMLFKALYAKL